MRARMIFLLIAILLVAGFVALNWSEVLRPAPLSFGWRVTEAPMGLILLVVLLATVVAFIASSAVQQTHYLLDMRQHTKELQSQRDLADRAEASRFTDLRQHLDSQLRENRENDGRIAAEVQAMLAAHQRESRAQMEQLGKQFSFQLTERELRASDRQDLRNSANAV